MALDLQLLHLGWAAAPGSGGQSLAITPPPRRQDTPLGHHLSPFTQAGSGGRRVHPAAQLDRGQEGEPRPERSRITGGIEVGMSHFLPP